MSNEKLVSGEELLKELFGEESRPSIRWLRNQQKARAFPYKRVGRLVFFDPAEVRAALDAKKTVRAMAK